MSGLGGGKRAHGSTISLVTKADLILFPLSYETILGGLKIAVKISGQRCPFPGRLPHGTWTCEMQEIPIQGTSFLDEEAQSYPGEEKYFNILNI